MMPAPAQSPEVAPVHTDPAQVREFFAARAANWETRYPDDAPAYEAAVALPDA